MKWRHYADIVDGPVQAILDRLRNNEEVDRIVLEGNLGSEAVPVLSQHDADRTTYQKAWLFGHPVLAMVVRGKNGTDRGDVWFTQEALGAWKVHVEGAAMLPPRKRAKVYETGDETNPYVILGMRVRRWNASQDLPKPLVGATEDDPDGNAFLGQLGGRWRPITHALVAEMVKDARRAVPETTGDRRYTTTSLGEGTMIRFGKGGPVWVDAAAAVHLADLAGYPLGYPDEISYPIGGEGWTLLSQVVPDQAVVEEILDRLVMADQIRYASFSEEIGPQVLRSVFPEYRWGRGGPIGERMKDDDQARYSRRLYRGHPVIVAVTSTRTEAWLSSSAQAMVLRETANRGRGDEETEAVVAPTPATEPAIRSRPFKKRHRKTVARLARAIAKLRDEGLVLVMDAGILKACREDVDPNETEKEGLITVLPESMTITMIG